MIYVYGSWKTIKNKYIISLINDLSWLKIYLRLSYHQFRISVVNIPKIVFRTWYNHYEFLLMFVGSTNAPTTFLDFMNCVLRSFLDFFMIIFINHVLLYQKVGMSMSNIWGFYSIPSEIIIFMVSYQCINYGLSLLHY